MTDNPTAGSAQFLSKASLDEVLFDLSVNFLLYVVIIIVFYMLVRFYLEEETAYHSYSRVPTDDDVTNTGNVELASPGTSNTSSIKPVKIKRTSSFLNLNEWGEPEGTKDEVLQRLVLCAGGLIISFCFWGLLQERMLTQTYDGEYFTYSYGLVFQSRVVGLLLSGFLMWYLKQEWEFAPLWEYSFPSVANMLSSWCQYEALRYVSFPTQMLAKGFKMVPVMLAGTFLHEKRYESYEYASAIVVGIGLYLFIDSTENIGKNI